MQKRSAILGLASVGLTIGLGLGACDIGSQSANAPENWLDTEAAWSRDAIWNDGQAEYAVYEAKRTIYGTARSYEAVMITNTQHMDLRTTTKASNWKARTALPVFKFNVREVIPTENYDYKYLTTSFVRSGSLEPFKIAMSSQEDCGTTYKQVLNRNAGYVLEQFSYFPDEGHDRLELSDDVVFHDVLPTVMRSMRFDSKPGTQWEIDLLDDLTDTHLTPDEPRRATLTYVGPATIDVPIGSVETHHVRLVTEGSAKQVSDYWFAQATKSPWLNIMVRYRDDSGQSYELKSNRRWAYWERP